MAYQESIVYAKYLASKINEESSSDCGCNDCSNSTSDSKCSCCPPGLVAVYNVDGVNIGCLTPADADEYNTNNRSCKEGYVALYKNGTPNEFLGCVASDQFAALYAAVNP